VTAPEAFRLLGFYATPPHACSYLEARTAVTVFADPDFPKDRRLYTVLSQHGFRRSGEHIYRPHCPGCAACVPVRVPVQEFRPRRSQRRTWRRNADLEVAARPAAYDPRHYALYERYLASRHRGGGMDNPTPDRYLEFLTSPWADTVFFEHCTPQGAVVAVSVADVLEDGLSAVYTFFDPDLPERSLGVQAVLHEIEEARRLGMRYLYLGYWIGASRKMRYKTEYQPLEYLVDGEWTREAPEHP
jgi:arginine-tRNA-protein transferase